MLNTPAPGYLWQTSSSGHLRSNFYDMHRDNSFHVQLKHASHPPTPHPLHRQESSSPGAAEPEVPTTAQKSSPSDSRGLPQPSRIPPRQSTSLKGFTSRSSLWKHSSTHQRSFTSRIRYVRAIVHQSSGVQMMTLNEHETFLHKMAPIRGSASTSFIHEACRSTKTSPKRPWFYISSSPDKSTC